MANATVGHGLGVAPKMIFFKNMSASGNWNVYHGDIGKDKRLYLNTTAAQETATNYMNDTAPTSSVFSVGVATDTNGNGNDQIAYCFAEVKGFSQFGTYSGSNTTDGPFIYTGFRPAFYLWKKYEGVDSWNLVDSKRIGYNPNNNRLFTNSTAAEDTQDRVDLVANGIKIRTKDSGTNGSGVAYMYMAFAEFPFVGSNETPGVAR